MEPNQLETQLHKLEDDRAAATIAARSALRLIPVMRLWDFEKPSLQKYLLTFFRGMVHIWIGARYSELLKPETDMVWHDLDLICNEIEPIQSIGKESKAAFFAINQAGKALAGLNVMADARAAISKSLEYSPETASAVEQDFELFDLLDTNAIAHSVLWSEDSSSTLSDTKKYIPDLWSKEHPEWSVWSNLYNRYIVDSADGEKLFLQLTLLDDAFWSRPLAEINGDLTALVQNYGDPSITVRVKSVAGNGRVGKAKVSVDEVKNSSDSPKTPETRRSDVLPQSDEATSNDQLDRVVFARAVMETMEDVLRAGGNAGFAVHIHAPWGAGKSSVLAMMQDIMEEQEEGKRWAVAHFNAWEHEKRNPPWWPLIEEVKASCSSFARTLKSNQYSIRRRLWFTWYWWKLQADWLPIVISAVFGSLLVILLFGSENGDGISWLAGLKVVLPILGVIGTFVLAGRALVFGSKNNAEFYFSLSIDPLKKVKQLFGELHSIIDRPICIFIDDLDRCQSAYVVALLEGIQTSFRGKDIVYVVAADKDWIRFSFEEHYKSYTDKHQNKTEPLGHLFLEKIFQLSVSLPSVSGRQKEVFWQHLLTSGGASKAQAIEIEEGEHFASAYSGEDLAKRRDELKKKFSTGISVEDAAGMLESDKSAINKAAVVLELSASQELEKQAKHILHDFSHIIPANPRVMKRLLNSFRLRQSMQFLQDGVLPPDKLIRWLILEHKYPLLVEALKREPQLVEQFISPTDDLDERVEIYFYMSEVRKIIAQEGNLHLSAKDIPILSGNSL